jgi:uncharacterized membrane protein YkvA (DUF1232 family)
LSNVPIAKTGRVDLEAIKHALLSGHAAEHPLCHGRAADISEADEEDTMLSHAGSNGIKALPAQDEPTWRVASVASCSTRRIHLFFLWVGALAPSREVETMVAWNDAAELRNAALGKEIALSTFAERERKVRRDFWSKLKRFAGMVPFVEDLVAAYYCALDPATPMRVRGMLLAALAYFILPVDLIPDMIAGLGFADDAALLTAVIGLVASHITPTHRAAAARALDKELPAKS